jgi:hypothetical protein
MSCPVVPAVVDECSYCCEGLKCDAYPEGNNYHKCELCEENVCSDCYENPYYIVCPSCADESRCGKCEKVCDLSDCNNVPDVDGSELTVCEDCESKWEHCESCDDYINPKAKDSYIIQRQGEFCCSSCHKDGKAVFYCDVEGHEDEALTGSDEDGWCCAECDHEEE